MPTRPDPITAHAQHNGSGLNNRQDLLFVPRGGHGRHRQEHEHNIKHHDAQRHMREHMQCPHRHMREPGPSLFVVDQATEAPLPPFAPFALSRIGLPGAFCRSIQRRRRVVLCERRPLVKFGFSVRGPRARRFGCVAAPTSTDRGAVGCRRRRRHRRRPRRWRGHRPRKPG